MIKYREILRLHAAGVSLRNIAYSCKCATSTVQSVINHAQSKGLSWPLPEEMDDATIKSILYPPKSRVNTSKAPIDHEYIKAQMMRRGVTMQLLWNEYCEMALAEGKEPYQYSAFCQHHRQWAGENNITMHIERKPAEQMQVDWSGDTMEVCDPDTGEILKVYIFVACLPYSSKIYTEGFYRMDTEAWISAHIHAFSFYGGSTPVIVPDNLKTGVIKNTIDELIINEQYRRMCEYYGCAVVPARVRKPRDKGSVEMSVNVVERQAIAALRDRVFLSLKDLNEALSSKVNDINMRPFQKREGSREEVFLNEEKDYLIPLPQKPYQMTERKHATVQFNYHVSFDGSYYSVPFSYVRREVEITATRSAVTIMCDGKRLATHVRNNGVKGRYITNPEHMPQAHRDFTEWDGDRFRKSAAAIGESTAKVIDMILSSRKIEQQSYRSCRSVLSLAKKHSETLLEEACAKALMYSPVPSYKTVKSIIGKLAADAPINPDEYAYLRGSEYYKSMEEEV